MTTKNQIVGRWSEMSKKQSGRGGRWRSEIRLWGIGDQKRRTAGADLPRDCEQRICSVANYQWLWRQLEPEDGSYKYHTYGQIQIQISHPAPPTPQSIARGPFQLSRRDRESLPFSLVLRDEIENFCLSVSCFETRMRICSCNLMLRDENEICFCQSRASRREREFLLSVSCIETRTRIFTFSLILRDENFCLNSCTSRREREQCWGMASLIFSPVNNKKEFRWMNLINNCRNISLHSEEILFNWQQEILYRFGSVAV